MSRPSPSFLEAQQRVAARRRAREVAAHRALHSQPSSSSSFSSSSSDSSLSLPPSLQRIPYFPYTSLNTLLRATTTREGTAPAFRVGQVDAELLDEELIDLLRQQVGEGLKYFSNGHLKDDYASEVLLALRAVLFKLTVWDHDATYGAALQNLKYTDARHDDRGVGGGGVLARPSRWQKGIYGFITVFGKYGWEKWENWLLDRDDGYSQPNPRIELLSRLTTSLTTVHSAAACLSFLIFLLKGRYRTLLDRILRMRLAPPTSQVSREVSFEYLNRQLVWHAFTEFLLFVLPLIGINRWRRWIARTWRRTKDIIKAGQDPSSDGGSGSSTALQEEEKKGEMAFLPERTCAICYSDQNSGGGASEEEILAASSGVIGSAQTDVTNPYEAVGCGCIYCFVCLATRLEREEGEGWTCLRCGEVIKECKPWAGDVLETGAGKAGGGDGRRVAFREDVRGGDDEEEEEEEESEGSGEVVEREGEGCMIP